MISFLSIETYYSFIKFINKRVKLLLDFIMSKKPIKEKTLAAVNPQLAKEWHPTKNEVVTPYNVTPGSNKKVWWKCPKGKDHEWKADVYSRSRGQGCSICSGRTVVLSNCLATVKPEIAKQWHQQKNDNLTPFDVTFSSGKKVWWKCSEGEDHEWIVSINSRVTFNSNCPFCSGRKVSSTNCLSNVDPYLASQWHPKMNGGLEPNQITFGSGKKVWWQCEKEDDHVWQDSPNHRAHNRDCPFCINTKITVSNSLASLSPEIAKQWHPTKNGDLRPEMVGINSVKKAWWKCEMGDDHVWLAEINRRKINGCPYCGKVKLSNSNSLAFLYPDIADEWHPTKNSKTTPEIVFASSNKKYWWKCEEGGDHEWKATPGHRIQGRGCPICDGKKVVESNSLESTHPKISSEWHLTKNKAITPQMVTRGSKKKVWWQCSKNNDHIWKTTPNSRTSQNLGCPYCTLTPQSKQELTITFELKQFFDINPRGFKTRVNGKLWSIDIFINEFNLGIEFDGNYWHKNKSDLDKLKTQKLEEDRFQIMRIREEPLKPITPIDIISKLPFNAKKVTNEILHHILVAYKPNPKIIEAINVYLRKRTLQNEKGLNDYIEIILEEKSKKKRTTTKPKLH